MGSAKETAEFLMNRAMKKMQAKKKQHRASQAHVRTAVTLAVQNTQAEANRALQRANRKLTAAKTTSGRNKIKIQVLGLTRRLKHANNLLAKNAKANDCAKVQQTKHRRARRKVLSA